MLLFVHGGEQKTVSLEKTPFTIGRKTDRDLVIPDSRVSREHALIVAENGEYYVVDQGSRSGTFVNRIRRERYKLQANDRMDFGADDIAWVIFNPSRAHTATATSAAGEFLSQVMAAPSAGGELEKLRLFLEAAAKLSTTGVLADVLATLLDSTLRLTKAERGFVFLRDEGGKLQFAAGRDAQGEALGDETAISRSILEEAANAASEFIVGDTSKNSNLSARNSIMALDLRTVIAIPLRKRAMQEKTGKDEKAASSDVSGVLYLDSRFASRDISAVSHDILRAIATEAAALVENARLVQSEEAAKRYRQELSIASAIQQRLMTVRIPEVPFAVVQGRNLPCLEVGGDFFDVVRTKDALSIVVTDICGKGVSAALLASVLQGMLYSQLIQGLPLDEAVTAVHLFLCEKAIGEKYATMVVARLRDNGELELVNCGHVPPRIISGKTVHEVANVNPPVGLIPDVSFASERIAMKPGDRLIVVTDCVVEAENEKEEFFGYERLDQAAVERGFDGIFEAVREFCGTAPLQDDCTVVELTYRTAQAPAPQEEEIKTADRMPAVK
jgi:sigma-B regulation protein RsbU (phosphoserine phosphatase)